MRRIASALLAVMALAGCSRNPFCSPDGKVSVDVTGNGLQVRYAGNPVQTIEIEGEVLPGENIEIVVRNDGVAFRFLQKERKTTFLIPEGLNRWIGCYGFTGYEALFPKTTGSAPGKWIYPALVEYSDGVFGFIAEADIRRDHSCSHLATGDEKGRYVVETTDADPQYDVTPWRVLLVGPLENLVASTMIEDLSEPSRIEDTSWIKPGVASWIYWAYNHGSKDFKTVCNYIDLAAAMGWPYCLVDWEWPQMEGGYTIDDVMKFAFDKGVRILLWYNSGTSWVGPGAPQPEDLLRTPEAREKEFAWLESIGVAGVKVDFFAEDGAGMVNYYLDILEDAAKHHLLVDFHGCTVPRGWQRTWPNLVSLEAVYGAEWYNNVPTFTDVAPSHNATLPFTRGLMGPMDYTPCTFTDSQHPHITTHAHELALTVLFQSDVLNMADTPESYLSQPLEVRRFLSSLPTVWDETRLICGYPGEYVVMARRKGDVWYVAGINGTDAPVTLDGGGFKGDITLFADGSQDREFSISQTDQLGGVSCRAHGGFLAVIKD